MQNSPQVAGELADLLFSGLSERPMWAGFLRLLARRLDARCAAFVFAGTQDASTETTIITADPAEAALIAPLLDENVLQCFSFEQPAVLTRAAHQVCAGLRMHADRDREACLVLVGEPDGKPLASDWREILFSLQPLLQRIVRLYILIGEGERRRRVAEYVLETSGVGVVLVDSKGSVLMANAVAHEIMAQSGVLTIVDSRLRATRSADQQLLMRHIREKADEQTPHAGVDCYTALSMDCDASPHPITIIIRPGPPYAPVSAPLRRTAMIVMRDPARRGMISAVDLERMFDLSPAEARLARLLADGLSMEEVALQLGVRRTTVRSQLQSIFAKTGTNRQGDLVRLVLSSAAPLVQKSSRRG